MTVHPFECAGLGKAPFKFIGVKDLMVQIAPGLPMRAGGSCDYCGTSIGTGYVVRSIDGRVFKVGCDCIEKVNKLYPDSSLMGAAQRAKRKREAAKRAVKREAKRLATVDRRDRVVAAMAAAPNAGRDRPHPNHPLAASGKSLRDYWDWGIGVGATSIVVSAAKELGVY